MVGEVTVAEAAVLLQQIHTLMQADYLLGYRRDRPLRMPQLPYEGES